MNRLTTLAVLGILVVACGGSATPSVSPGASPSLAPGASPSLAPAASASPGVSAPPPSDASPVPLAPSDRWRPVLELVSGPGGSDSGSFRASGRYRMYQHCLGAGSITIEVAVPGSAARTTEVSCGAASEPASERFRGARGLADVTVTVEGEPHWLVVFEVPRD